MVLPPELTGVQAKIVVALGDRFPMISAHKVLAAYGCLAPRVITGQFDPTRHRAVWPSTGNYCRGGVAISRIMGCPRRRRAARGDEPGALRLARELGGRSRRHHQDAGHREQRQGDLRQVRRAVGRPGQRHLQPVRGVRQPPRPLPVHRDRARVPSSSRCARPSRGCGCAAFVSASGSAGTLAAGDYLKERYGARIVAVEALECPTMLANGFGEHNIQGIGDKHVPLIHNVMNTDFVAGVSDRATDELGVLFATRAGSRYLRDRRRRARAAIEALPAFGLSSICNVLAAVKTAKHLGLGPDDVIITVATDGAEMYGSERQRICARDFPDGFDARRRGEAFGRWMLAAGTDHLLETTLGTATASSTSATSPGSSSRASASPTSRPGAIRSSGPGCATCCPPGTR